MAVQCLDCGRFARTVAVYDSDLTITHCYRCDGPNACYVLGDPMERLFHDCPVCGEVVMSFSGYVDEGVYLGHPTTPGPDGAHPMALFPSAGPNADGYVHCVGGWGWVGSSVAIDVPDTAVVEPGGGFGGGLPDLRGTFGGFWDTSERRLFDGSD